MSEGMARSTLGEISELITSGSRGWAEYYADDGALFLRMTNLPREGTRLLLDDVKFVRLPAGQSEGLRTGVRQGDVLVSITAELGKVGLVDRELGQAYVNQHLALVRPNSQKVEPAFLAHYLAASPQRKRFQRLNDAGAKAGLSLRTMAAFAVDLPPLREQRRIALVLSAWESAIEKTRELARAKSKQQSSLSRRLIDLPAAAGTWPVVKLSSICSPVTRRNADGATHVLTASARLGLVDQLEYFSKDVSGADLRDYYLLRRGEFAYNRSTSEGYPYGAIKRLDRYDEGVLSTLNICFKLDDEAVDSDFLCRLFASGVMNRELGQVCQVGSRAHGLLNVTKSDFFALRIALPATTEQRRIAHYLATAEREVALLRSIGEAYARQKQALAVAQLSPNGSAS